MPTSRLEAFSDGVLAIVITIMVLELKLPAGDSLADLWRSTGLGLLSYLLSFVYVGIYWNNHHHLLHAVDTVTGSALWANLHLMFWLSLLPLATGWMDATHLSRTPVLCYGVVLLMCAAAYILLQSRLLRAQREGSRLARALRSTSAATDRKNKASLGLYVLGIVAALLDVRSIPAHVGAYVALACYVAVALLWLVPDRRLEAALRSDISTEGRLDD